MQLKALRLGAMAFACAVLFAAALPGTHTSAQTSDEPAVSSEHEAEQLRVRRSVLGLVRHVGKAREHEVRILRSIYSSSVASDILDSQIAWIEGIESGDPRVMFETALRLRDGDGLPQRRDAALTWLERAGDHGVPEGLFEASRMLLNNPIRDGDIWRSDALLTRAARRGVAAAQKELGLQLASGGARPLRRDRVREGEYLSAYIWLLLAQANGADVGDMFATDAKFLPERERQMARAIVERAVGRNLPWLWPGIEDGAPEEWREKLSIAMRWEECERVISVLTGAAQDGETEAELELARSYDNGTCVEADPVKALAHYEVAAKDGDTGAILRLGFNYYDGPDAPRDLQKAGFWFKAAALSLVAKSPHYGRRLVIAKGKLPRGSSAFQSREIPPELAAEIGWLREIEDSEPQVLFRTALRVRDGDGLPRVRDAAVAWLRLAAKRGVMEANYDLGIMLLDAPRGYLDTSDGIRALAVAGGNGFVPALVELGRRFAVGDGVRQWDYAAYVWLLIAEDKGAEVTALLEEVGGRMSEYSRQDAREDAKEGTYYPLESR